MLKKNGDIYTSYIDQQLQFMPLTIQLFDEGCIHHEKGCV
jgi:hypothetical protein